MRRTPKLWLRSSDIVEKFSAVHQLTATLTATVSLMSGDDKCLVFGQTGHFGCHCLCPGLPHKIPPSGTPCHCWRSHSKHWHTHNWRDRLHSNYGPRHRRQYSRSQLHPHSQHHRSSSFRRHTSHSSSIHHNSWHHPSANRWSCYPSHHDTKWYSCTSSHTWHISCRCHSHNSMDQSWSYSSSCHHAAQGSQEDKAMLKTINHL